MRIPGYEVTEHGPEEFEHVTIGDRITFADQCAYREADRRDAALMRLRTRAAVMHRTSPRDNWTVS